MAGRTPLARIVNLLGRGVRGLFALGVVAALAAGLPWALIYAIGWPLPDHLPSPEELERVLMAPMSTSLLLNVLACLLWALWLVFVLDVAACTVDVARGARWSHLRGQAGPVRRVAAVLVGAVLVAVLGRTVTAAAAPSTLAEANRPGSAAPAAVRSAGIVPADGEHTVSAQSSLPAPPGTERARPPHNGVHDSLWRIAQRCLGDGDRWPDIWALNQGSAQAGGRVLTNPNRIRPGDLLRVPAAPAAVAPASPPPPLSAVPAPIIEPAPSAPRPITRSSPDPSPSEVTAGTDTATDHSARGAVTWGEGEVFVSLSLAAAVSAVFVLARRRRQARYRPGSGRRDDDLPVTPVVYQLHLAHLRAQHHDEDTALERESAAGAAGGTEATAAIRQHGSELADHDGEGQVRALVPRRRRVAGTVPAGAGGGPAEPPWTVDIAVSTTAPRAGAATAADEPARVALDLARVHGLGLVGPGGYAAARALLLALLTAAADNPPTRAVYVPVADVARLLGVPGATTDLPRSITVVADLDTALAALDASQPQRPAVLITAAPEDPGRQARLQQLLDNEAQHGLTALLLGQWRAGVTAYVTAGGTISATDPGLGEPLRGTRAFTLPETATRDLLAFLRTEGPFDNCGGTADAELSRQVPEPAKARTRRGTAAAALSRHVGYGAQRLEITSGAPVPAPARCSEPGDQPRPPAPSAEPPIPASLTFTVFGAAALHWRPHSGHPEPELRDLSGELSTRLIELLVFLAVHPGGVSRDAIVDALWPHQPPRNPASVLRTVLSRVRRALDTATRGAVGEPVLAEHGQYRLDPAVVDVDYWGFAAAAARRRTASTPAQRAAANEAIVAHYGGVLADGLDSDWLVAARESTRRDALDAVAALARTRVESDPDYTLDLLETARAFDPYNELLYRDVMRLQHTLGRHDAISRTLDLLRTRLAEIDDTPTAETVDLAKRLRARDTGIRVKEPPGPWRHE